MTAPLGEFERIARFFAPLAAPEALGLADDAAYLDPRAGKRLVLKTDAIVEGVHYLADDPPDLVARKALRVNLSDLAAKGARPLGYLLTTALPAHCDDDWLAAFAAGLAADQDEFGIGLFGGDSVATPGPAMISVTMLGEVAPGREILRGGARAGEVVFVSGTLGDAALGLRAARGTFAALAPEAAAMLIARYRLPQPRLALGARLGGLASGGLDVSDGLVADLGHLCDASGVGAVVEAARLPLSPAARQAIAAEPALGALALGGGDDYELLFTAPSERRGAIAVEARRSGVPVSEIGRLVPGSGVRVIDEKGDEVAVPLPGYRHF